MEPDMHFDIKQHQSRVYEIGLYFYVTCASIDSGQYSDEHEALDAAEYILWLRSRGYCAEYISSACREFFYDIYD